MDEKNKKERKNQRNDEQVDLGQIFWQYFIFWRWIIISVLLSLIVGYFYYKMQSDLYKVSSSILIIDSQKNATDQMAVLDELGIKTGVSDAQNELMMLRSPRLMTNVIRSLKLSVNYFQWGFFNKKSDIYGANNLIVEPDSAKLEQLADPIILNISPDVNGTFFVSGKCGNYSFNRELNGLPAELNLPMISLLLLPREKGQTVNQAITVDIRNPKSVSSTYLGALSAEIGKKNEVITLSLKIENQQKGKDILLRLVDLYNEDAIAQINRSAVNTAHFIDDRMQVLTRELAEVEKNVESYKQENKITDISSDADIFRAKSGDYQRIKGDVENQIDQIKYIDKFMRSDASWNSIIPDLGLTDRGLASMIADYNTLVVRREQTKEASSEESPLLNELTIRIVAARKAIYTGIQNAREALNIKLSGNKMQDELMQDKIHDIPRKEREFIEIKRQQQIKEQLYLFLLQKREETVLSMAVTTPKARVVSEPTSGGQISPNRNMILIISFMIGLFFPILVIYFYYLFNTHITDRRDLERYSELPVLCEMPHFEPQQTDIVVGPEINPATELFNFMRARLNFVMKANQDKVILITSTDTGDGKTFISLNLAVSLSMTRKKVLLVGLDLRKPRLARKFGLDNKDGISLFLSEQAPNCDDFIFKIEKYPYLSILPSGVEPPNPNELLLSDKLDELFTQLRTQYDYILIDSAPVGLVSDTYLLNRISDITLYIYRAGVSHKQELDVVNRSIEENSLSRVYLVLNDIDLTTRRGYYSGGVYRYGNYTYNDKQQRVKKNRFLKWIRKG